MIELPVGLVHSGLVFVDIFGHTAEHPILICDLLVEVLRLHLRPLYYPLNLVQLGILIPQQKLLLLQYRFVVELSRHIVLSVLSSCLLHQRIVFIDIIGVDSGSEHDRGGLV